MAEAIIIRDVRMYPDGKLYELVHEVKDPEDQHQLRMAKESVDIQHWSNIKRMLNSPEEYGFSPMFVSNAKRFKITRAPANVGWIVPDEEATVNWWNN